MTTKAAEKIIEGLTSVMEGFYELRRAVREDLGATGEAGDDEEEEAADPELEADVESAVANEMRAAIETVLESEEYSSEELAAMLSAVTEGLEEVDPDVFAEQVEESDDDDLDYDYDDDDEIVDLDDEDDEDPVDDE